MKTICLLGGKHQRFGGFFACWYFSCVRLSLRAASHGRCSQTSQTSAQPRDCITAALLSHTEKNCALCVPGLVSASIVVPAKPLLAAEPVPGVSPCKSLTNQDLMIQKHTPRCGASWCQQSSSLCLLRCQCHWPKLNLSPNVFLLFFALTLLIRQN